MTVLVALCVAGWMIAVPLGIQAYLWSRQEVSVHQGSWPPARYSLAEAPTGWHVENCDRASVDSNDRLLDQRVGRFAHRHIA
ncbi:hypothetical protein IQ268_00090 [Oculatella sp. LEGE 06141]|uniref:hypothetical protein n=1 Tax=Oculatella sp. LEGE 06141 TaxID=1828648 RepID=UPI001880B83D|nr:hypothetical protein [Oculatella sp. LEGE 06141]MBE9176975.1 hypothetical protein [Oculatella sp. LEGE 06141]